MRRWAHWRAGVKPYKVSNSTRSGAEIYESCAQVAANYSRVGLSNSFELYQRFIAKLGAIARVRLVALKDLVNEVDHNARLTIGLRHDLDGDLHAGLHAAEYLAKKGLPGSFYLLHTAHYYGVCEGGKFHRHEGLSEYVSKFVETGGEIGLHIDPLCLYAEHNINGAEAVAVECQWLRSAGASVVGVVAHNSSPVYGAENFEVFKGLALANRLTFELQGRELPLQSLSLRELGITYEGNFPTPRSAVNQQEINRYFDSAAVESCVRTAKWQRFYFLNNPYFERVYDIDIWLLGQDTWVVANRRPDSMLLRTCSTNEVLEYLSDSRVCGQAVINIHPEYVSRGVY